MSEPDRIVLVNSGPLMALGKLHRLDLLAKLYGEVKMPRAVYREVVVEGLTRGHEDALTVQIFWKQQGWPVEDISEDVLKGCRPETILDAGELELLALAITLPECLVLLDDEMARAEARRLKLPVKGTLGILVAAHRQKHLAADEIELLFQEISARPDIWISGELCRKTLEALKGSS